MVELLDYDPESNVTGKKELSVLDDHYARLLEAMDSVKTLGLDESADKPGSSSAQTEPAKAPLAQMETDGLGVWATSCVPWSHHGRTGPVLESPELKPLDLEPRLTKPL